MHQESTEVTVHIQSAIQHPGQQEDIHEVHAAGELIRKNNVLYLQYEELHEGSSIKTMIKLDRKEAFVMRRGAVQMRLPFTESSRRPGTYGYGPTAFQLIVQTDHLQMTEKQERASGQFEVHYKLYDDSSMLGTYKLKINYTEGQL